MTTYSIAFEDVAFTYTYDELMTEINADSAYIAKSMGVSAGVDGVASSLPFIVTSDEETFVRAALSEALNVVLNRMSAYLAESRPALVGTYVVRLLLPERRKEQYDSLISNELRRALVTYVLVRWYENRLPDVALRQQQLHNAAISTAMHDIFMLYGGVRRKSCFY